MRDTGKTANVISFTAAFSMCEKGGRSQQALALLHNMRDTGTTADVICFNVAISAYEKGRAVGAGPGAASQDA